MLTLPNFLTFLRILAIPAFLVFLAQGRYAAAFILLVSAGMTDAVDGALARLTDTQSDLGAVLDPMADKLLLLSSFLVLGLKGTIPGWLVTLVVMRDVIVVLGYVAIFVVDHHWVAIDPSKLGKASTFVQLFTVGFALMTLARPDLPMTWINYVMQGFAAVMTAASGVHYVYRGLLWHQRHGNLEESS